MPACVVCRVCGVGKPPAAFYASCLRKRTYRCKPCVLADHAKRRRQQPAHVGRLLRQAVRHGARLSPDTVTELVMTVFGGRSALSGTGSLAQLTLVPLDPTQPLGRDNAVVLTRSEARAHMHDTRGLHQYPAAWVCAVRTALACGTPSSLPPGPCDGVAGVLHRFGAAYGGLPAAWTERLETALPELMVGGDRAVPAATERQSVPPSLLA